MKNKILSLLLAVIMLVSALSVMSVSADTAECSYTVNDGAAVSGTLSDAVAACVAGAKVVVTLNSCTLDTGATYKVVGDLTINGGSMQNVCFKPMKGSSITLNNVSMTRNTGAGDNGFFTSDSQGTKKEHSVYVTSNNCTFKTVGDATAWYQFMIARYAYVTFNNCTIEADGLVSSAAVNKEATAANTENLTENQGACFTFWSSKNGGIGYLYLNDVIINTPNDTYGLINVMSLDGTLRTYGSRIYMTNVKYDAAGTEMDFDTNEVVGLADGASVRTVEGTEGLRFSTTISKDAYKYADNIVWKSEFKHSVYSGKSVDSATGLIKDVVGTDMGKRVNADESVTYNVVLANIKDNKQVYSVKSELKYEVLGGFTKIYIYSSFDAAKNSRSLQDAAKEALYDVKPTQVEDGAFPYAFAVELDGKTCYSRYTAAQYEVLKKFAGADYAYTAPIAE